MKFKLKIWRQKDASSKGRFETYHVDDISADCSFLEMLDILNEKLVVEGNDGVAFSGCPVSFDNDCREGICGMCGLYINGQPHGPEKGTTTCELHMRSFRDGQTIVIEPWRAKPFPVIKDLVVDRSAFDKIIQAGGFVSINTGSAQDANSILAPKYQADLAFETATCIGCGACVAACPNAAAMLFVGAKVSHLAYLPQGKIEAVSRVKKMVGTMEKIGFGSCSNIYACEAECPKNIHKKHIAKMNREFLYAAIVGEKGQ
jgi:succinate dehydrogenase / fumarate reductase, iron-sulfur subunit